MKTPPHQTPVAATAGGLSMTTKLCLAMTLAMFASVSWSSAAVIVKTNNVTALNLAGSWTNSVVPGVADIAQWDNTVSDVNNTTNTLGANLTWGGLKILNPVAKLQINAGNSLTNGASGIDMTAATVDVALSNTVCIAPGAVQQWNVAPGRTLSVLAIPSKPGLTANVSGVLQVGTTGTVKLGAAAVPLILDNQNNPWATYGQNDWAALDSSGTVIAATYTASTGAGLTAGANNDVVNDFGGGGGSAIDMASLRFNDPTFRTWNIANSGTSRTMTARGILVTANSGGGLMGGNTAASFLRPNRVTTGTSTSFNIIQNSPADFTIAVNISNPNSQTTRVIKSGPGNLILATPGYGSGGTEINGGTVTVAAGATLGSGGVTVNNTGRLLVNASNTTFVATVSVNSGATNGIKINTAGAQQFISTVAFNAGATRCEFNYASGIAPSTTVAPLLVSNVTANGSIALDIYNNSLTLGVYPLIKYTNSLTGTGFGAFSLGFLPPHVLGYISNDTANTSISLVVTNVNQPIHWATGNAAWDIGTTANWKDTLGASTVYQQVVTPYSSMGDSVLFGDTDSGSSPLTVTLNTTVSPASVTANATKTYTISGAGNIGGLGGLTKAGSGTLTLATANAFSGGLNLNGGTVNFSALTNLGGGAINFGGGTLQYNGNSDDISVRTVNFNAGGATIDTAGNTVNFASPVGNSGAGGLTKAGAGTLTLNGTNRYTGNTVVANGTLTLGSGTTYISNSPAIIVNSGAIFDVNAIVLTLRGTPVQTLAGAGTISGTVVSSNGIISPGTNGVVGTLTFGNDLTIAGGSLNLDLATNPAQRDLIIIGGGLYTYNGTIQLNVTGTLTNGVYKLIQFAGGLNSGAGSSANLTIAGYSQVGKSLTLSDVTAGEIDLIVADTASDNIVWSGVGSAWDTSGSLNWLNVAAPWAYTNGDTVNFNEIGIANPIVSLQALVTPSSVVVSNETATYTINDGTGVGGGKISGAATIVKKGPGILIIATPNNNTGPTDLQNGTLQIGNGGTSGDLGTGNLTNNGAVVFAQTDAHSVSSAISGSGSLTQQGSSVVTLTGNNSYSGPTTISSGSLQVGNGGATGSLGSGAITNDGTLIYNRSGTLTVGNVKAGPANQGALTFSGSASYTLNGGNTYVNNTTVNGGVVTLSSSGVVPNSVNVAGSTGWLSVDGTGKVDLNGLDHQVNALSGNSGTAVITNSGTSITTTNLLTVFGTAGTTYSGIIADNAAGSKTTLVLKGANELRLNGASTHSGGILVGDTATLGFGPGASLGSGLVTLSNGTAFMMHNNGGTGVFPTCGVFIPDNSAATINSTQLGNGFAGLLYGGATATNLIGGTQGVGFSPSGVKQFQAFLGTVVVPTGGHLRFSSSSGIANGGDFTTFELQGTGVMNAKAGNTVTLGALQGDGVIGGPEVASTVTYIIGSKNLSTTFSGLINNGPGTTTNNAVTKTGSGTLTLDGTLSYVGATTVNNGVLALASIINPNTSLDTCPSITVTSNAVLDVSARTDSTLNLGVSIVQTLSGYGTIRGSLSQAATSPVNVGLGTLTVTNVATLNGALNMQLNRTNGVVTNSTLAALSFTIAGPLTVTNTGPALQGGDTFKLFNQAVTGFTATNLPALTGILYWTNNLAVNGSITVVNPVNTSPPPIQTSFNGTILSLSWPTNVGWTLQQQTNSLTKGLGTNWVDVPGSTTITSTNITVDPTKPTVFYRLKL